MRLNNKQNELLSIHTSFYMFMCTIGFAAYLTGVFSMNFDASFFKDSNVFIIVVSITVFVIFGGYYIMLSYFQFSKMIPKKYILQV